MNPIEAHVELDVKPIHMEMEEPPEIVLEVEDYIGSGGAPPDYYEGEYNIIPKTVEQKLDTKQKTMRADVTLEKIPVHEFSNDFGTTIVIGGIL